MTAIAVVSARRGVGKTKLAEKVTKWLASAGFDVQFIKHSDHEYTLADKDNERAFLAGARRATTVFTNIAQTLESVKKLREYLAEWEGVTVVEGFRGEEVPKIVVAKSTDDLPVPGVRGRVMAVVAPEELREAALKAYPTARFFGLEDDASLRSWLIEMVSRSFLAEVPTKDCRACGFGSCSELLRAVVAGSEKISRCVALSGDVRLRVNSRKVFLTKFPASVIKAVCTALISQLKLRDEDIRTIEIKIVVERGEGAG